MNINHTITAAAVLLTIAAIFYPVIALAGSVVLILLLIFLTQPLKNILVVFAFLLVAVSSDLNEVLRNILNISAIAFMGFYYLKENGLAYSSYQVIPKPVGLFILFVIISMLFSSLFSGSILIGFTETSRQLVFFLIWYVLFSAITGEKDLFNYVNVLIASGTTLGLIIIYHLVTTGTSIVILIAEGLLHEGGILNNPAAAGGVFAVSIPLSITSLFVYSDSRKLKYIFSLLLAVQAAGILLTNSRAAVIAAFVSSFVLVFILKRKLFYKSLAAIAAVLLLTALLSPFLLEMADLYFRTGRILENTRYLLWEMSAGIIKDNPVLGTGPGQFKNYMYSHLPVTLGTWSAEQIKWVYESSGLGESHNFILFRTAELGIPGLISALLLPILFIYYCIKTMSTYINNRKIYTLAAGIFATGTGLFARSFLEATGLLSHGWISRDLPFWICFAVIIYLYKNSQQILNLKNENIITG